MSVYLIEACRGHSQTVLTLSATGNSLPVVSLYLLRMKSEICSSLACSAADSLDWSPPPSFSWTKSTAAIVSC